MLQHVLDPRLGALSQRPPGGLGEGGQRRQPFLVLTWRGEPRPSLLPSYSSEEEGAAQKIASFKICGDTGI